MWTTFKAAALLDEPREDAVFERGFRSRFKLNTHGVSVHFATLVPGVQNGHKHDSLCELVMLVDGLVVATRWDDTGCIDTFALKEQGDTVLFHPEQAHTLIVERESHVLVVRFAETDEDPNERIPLDLPSRLASARADFLNDPQGVVEAVLKGSQEQEKA